MTSAFEMCSLSDTWVSISQQALAQQRLASLRGTADGRLIVTSSAFGALRAPFDRFAPQELPHNDTVIPIVVYTLLHMSLHEHRLFTFCSYLANFRQKTATSPSKNEHISGNPPYAGPGISTAAADGTASAGSRETSRSCDGGGSGSNGSGGCDGSGSDGGCPLLPVACL